MKKNLLLFAILISFALSAYGCTEKTPSTLDTIKAKKKIIVGTEAAFPPMEFVENEKIIGYNPDLLKEVFKDSGIEIEQVDMPFSGIFMSLENKKIDAIVTATSVTEERKNKFLLTAPTAEDVFVIVVNKNNTTINNTDDLINKNVGYNAGSTPHKQAIAQNEAYEKEGKDIINIAVFQSHPESFISLKDGRIDALATNELVALSFIKQNPDDYKIAFSFGDKKLFSWTVRKEDKELADFINKRIIELKKNGKMAELQTKWFGKTWELPDSVY